MNTISQLLTADEGYPSTGITGTLAPIYEHKTFSKGGKDGSIQTAILKDSSGTSIRLKFWNMAEIKDEGGLTILPTDNGKGPKGLTVKDNEWQGKVTKELHIGDQARISWGESGEVIADEVMTQPVATETVAETVTETTTTDTSTTFTDRDSLDALPSTVIQNMNAMDICIQGASYLRKKYPNMTDDQFQGITSCMFIEGNKQGLNKSMPSTPLA